LKTSWLTEIGFGWITGEDALEVAQEAHAASPAQAPKDEEARKVDWFFPYSFIQKNIFI